MRARRLLVPGIALVLFVFTAPLSAQPIRRPFRPAQRIQIGFRPDTVIQPKVDLRGEIERFGLAVRDQGNRGTCSVFATTFLIEYQTARTKREKDLELSEEYLNWAKNRANHTEVDGGKFTDIIRGYQGFGMVPISDMPNRAAFNPQKPDRPRKAVIAMGRKFERYPIRFIKQWDNSNGMTGRQLEATKAMLRAGHPVATGIWWLQKFETATVAHVPLMKEYPREDNNNSDPSQNPMFDGHSIDLVGFHEGRAFPGGGYFIFRNSFGPGFGQNGYGFVSFKYIRTYANDAIVIDGAKRASTP